MLQARKKSKGKKDKSKDDEEEEIAVRTKFIIKTICFIFFT